MMAIDLKDGSTIILVGGQDVLQAAEIAREKQGRLRVVVSNSMSTSDPMQGCVQLGDWREQRS
jgi:ABC-type branched-subunit amino acid transport system substrate-binding protein